MSFRLDNMFLSAFSMDLQAYFIYITTNIVYIFLKTDLILKQINKTTHLFIPSYSTRKDNLTRLHKSNNK